MEKKIICKNIRESSALVITKKFRKNHILIFLGRWWNTISSFIGALIQIFVAMVVGPHY